MKRKHKTYMLALEKDDPEKELEFEVAFQLTLSEKQRYSIMKKLTKQSRDVIKKNDNKKSPAIICHS